jgi:hypothetical protein
MDRFRSRWLALFGGVTLIALSLSTAFAGKPESTNRGLEVSAFVHHLVGDVEETEDQADEETETEDDTEVEEEDEAPSAHGECVAAVAQDPEAVGPPNDNHGGAVSEAARVTCWPDESSPDDADAEVEESDDSDASDEADAADAGGEHGNGHGHGHGADSSGD